MSLSKFLRREDLHHDRSGSAPSTPATSAEKRFGLFGLELLPSPAAVSVELRLPLVVALTPLRSNQGLVFQAIQRL